MRKHTLAHLHFQTSHFRRPVIHEYLSLLTCSVSTAILYGAMSAGNASTLTPSYAKAKAAASYLMMLIKRHSAIDNLSEEGISLVIHQSLLYGKSIQSTYFLSYLISLNSRRILAAKSTWKTSGSTTRRAPTCPYYKG